MQNQNSNLDVMPVTPPFIWPEPRWHAQLAQYAKRVPPHPYFKNADLVAGVIVDAGDGCTQWLRGFLQGRKGVRISLVIVVYPACHTRESHLAELLRIQSEEAADHRVELNVLPVSTINGLPPTVVQTHNTTSNDTLLSIGSIGDLGGGVWRLTSFNTVFHPDDALRSEWRRWFEYIRQRSTLLSPTTIRIPALVPAVGDPEAAELWNSYERQFSGDPELESIEVEVDSTTGEVVVEESSNEEKKHAWDGGATALDDLARRLNDIYARGWLVTVDESTRIKPLAIPVKAALLGQRSEQSVGAVRRKQSFSLNVLDDEVAKEIEKCRKVTDLVDLTSYLLSKGNRLLPAETKTLLEKELEARNTRGIEKLTGAVGGNVRSFVEARKKSLTSDLNRMYSELGMGSTVPTEKLSAVLSEVERRLSDALGSRVTPRATYNRIAAPDLTSNAPDENWSQPFSLMLRAARLMRKPATDAYFSRNFVKTAFTQDDFMKAVNILGDVTAQSTDRDRASEQLRRIDEIEASSRPFKEKCHALWKLIQEEYSDDVEASH